MTSAATDRRARADDLDTRSPGGQRVAQDDDWKLPKRAERCQACEAELQPRDEVTTVIGLDADGPVRQDLCAACGQAAESMPDAIFWRRHLPESAATRPVVDYALLRELFTRMLAREEDLYRRLCYLIALVLVRKRHLRLKGFARRGAREVMVVNRGAGQPEFDVPAPFLAAEDLPPLRERLSRLLQADLGEFEADPEAVVRAAVAEEAAGDPPEAAEAPEAGPAGRGAGTPSAAAGALPGDASVN